MQELARFRKRALPSHFLLNCAITWRHHKGKYHYTKVENGPFSVVIGTYLTVAKAEKHSHAETLGKRNYILPRCVSSSKRNVSEENSRLGNLLQFLAHERDTEVSSPRLTFKYLPPMNYEIIYSVLFHFKVSKFIFINRYLAQFPFPPRNLLISLEEDEAFYDVIK